MKRFKTFLEANFGQLKADLPNFDNYRGNHFQLMDMKSMEPIWIYRINPKEGTCAVQFESEIESFDKPKTYQVVLMFDKVPMVMLTKQQVESGKYDEDYVKNDEWLKSEKTYTEREIRKGSGKEEKFLYFQKPEFGTETKIRCTCPDYRFRFQASNKKKGSLIGRVDPYTKVPGSNRPPVNPKQVSGYCKHIVNYVRMLDQKDVIDIGDLNIY